MPPSTKNKASPKTFPLAQFNLTNVNAIHKFIDHCQIQPNDLVIEIGAGTGNLTKKIAKYCHQVITYEVDKSLEITLKNNLKKFTNIEIKWKNFLKSKIKEENYRIIANPPFNITSPILKKILSFTHLPQQIDLILQKDVITKLNKIEGGHNYLSAVIQTFYEIHYQMNFKREDFTPKAHVQIAMATLKRKTTSFDAEMREAYYHFVFLIFQDSNKPLKNRLKSYFSHLQIKRFQKNLGIEMNEAPYYVSTEQWKEIFLFAWDLPKFKLILSNKVEKLNL